MTLCTVHGCLGMPTQLISRLNLAGKCSYWVCGIFGTGDDRLGKGIPIFNCVWNEAVFVGVSSGVWDPEGQFMLISGPDTFED